MSQSSGQGGVGEEDFHEPEEAVMQETVEGESSQPEAAQMETEQEEQQAKEPDSPMIAAPALPVLNVRSSFAAAAGSEGKAKHREVRRYPWRKAMPVLSLT